MQLASNGPNMRLFAVGYAAVTVTPPGGTATSLSGTGNLTIQDVEVQNFHVKGGDGKTGGGGGLGAGGAIYVAGGQLTVQNSTFENNRAVGGNGSKLVFTSGGGGGGLSGNGGSSEASCAPPHSPVSGELPVFPCCTRHIFS